MLYHEPTHGWWCNARTYPTRCRHCGAKVFYFSCDCGSKVFFDSLGWPWPVHDCVNSILQQVEISIAEEYARRVAERHERLRRGWKIPIRACHPQKCEKVESIGVVREVLPILDIFKKFCLPSDSPISVKLLGELARDSWMQITIHVNDLGSDEFISYTLLIKTDCWETAKIRLGDLVRFVAIGQQIPGRQPFWLCRSIMLAQPAL